MNTKELREFYIIVKDLINNPTVLQMKNYRQHYDTSCYDHCIEVAYWSYLFCKKFNLDYKAGADANQRTNDIAKNLRRVIRRG